MNCDQIKEAAINALRIYGVGTCGPPGYFLISIFRFYGTLDVHMELERRIADFTSQEDAILYSQSFACVSSVIPAFAKRDDIILCDDACNFAIQKGIQISRATVKYFKHGDMNDLEEIILTLEAERKKVPKILISEKVASQATIYYC